MKNTKILRILGIAIILSLLILTIPVLPVQAVNDISITPTTGKIGDTISISGSNYTPSTETSEKWARIIFAKDEASVGQYIDNQVTTYEIRKDTAIGYTGDADEGEFSTTFTVPSTLTDGDDDETVTSGTYYVYVVVITNTVVSTLIKSAKTFTVTAGGTLDPLSPITGKAGTDVTVSGANFAASSAITFKFDTTTLTPKSGSTQTTSGGMFMSVITIPASASAGAHSISVTVSSTTVTATFTVTASATLDPPSPATGKASTDVTVSGANFPASTALVFKFDTTTLTPKSGDASSRSSGMFLSTITIPANATAGSHTITVTAGTSTATATFTVTASAALDPLSPATGKAGTDITISGANFLESYPVIFKFDSATITPKSGDINTTTTGTFSSVITVPQNATSGAHTVSVTVGTTTVTAAFNVSTIPPTPTPTPSNTALNVVQNDYFVGAPIGISGAGFIPGANVTIKYNDKSVASTKVIADGTFQIIFDMPAAQHGSQQFTISDGINTNTANFTVEVKAPPLPSPLLPEMGAKLKTPISFDWEDVTDDSSPVTYNLQIATDKTFAAGSIVLDKKGIDKSQYTYTEIKGLQLESETIHYFWRVKAVDAALNESAWTGIGEFDINAPSSFPKWALYLIIGVAAVFLFVIGFWIGRRTAFYY